MSEHSPMPEEPEALPLKRVPFTEIVVFTCGAVMLSLEIIASRVLAPFFGSSVYVWGSLIGVFLTALSVGYVVGGRIADRFPSPVVFGGVVFVAGLLILPIPRVAPHVLGAILRIDFGGPLNSLLGAIALFVVPSMVLGVVSPFAVRLRARTVSTLGRTAGSLFAIGTAGSIAGTLLTSFVLINVLGVRAIVHAMGLVLMFVGTVALLVARRSRVATGGGLLLCLCLVVSPVRRSAAESELVHVRDTVYQTITISDEGAIRYLKLDNHWHSALDREHPTTAVFAYTDYLHLPLIFAPLAERVTLLGLGGGTVPNRYLADYPTIQMSVAEIDPHVVDSAVRFFDVKSSSRLTLLARDGRAHLRSLDVPQDVILADAYVVDALPVHLATQEFFALARARLVPGGVFAMNVIGAIDGADSKLFRALYKTLRGVFRSVYVFPVETKLPSSTASFRNIIVVGCDAPRLEAADVERRAAALVAEGKVTLTDFAAMARRQHLEEIRTDDVPLLTDDFAPVDGLRRW